MNLLLHGSGCRSFLAYNYKNIMYFFTEYDKLISQQTSTAVTPYGPVSSDPTKLYKISSEFVLSSSAKAIACQDAIMIVQPYIDNGVQNTSLVNIILKPLEGLAIAFPSIKYYVYRGIKIDSLMNASGIDIKPDSPTNSEFLNVFWSNVNNQITNGIITHAPKPREVFAYDSTAISTPVNQPGNMLIEELFNTSINANRGVKVSEGEWIGEFSDSVTIQFEIITDSDNYIEDINNLDHLRFDLNYFRKSKHIVDIIDISPTNGTLTSDQESFKRKVRREEILSFIDPAAFYGMHFYKGIKERYDNAGTLGHRKRKKQDIREFLLNKFYTCDKIYIDVRSEFGYSYNFYENYFVNGTLDAWEIKTEAAPAYIAEGYNTFDWPIFIAGSWISAIGKMNTVGIKMKMGEENRDPHIFIQNPQLLGRFKKKPILNWEDYPMDPSPALSDPFILKFPNNLTDNGTITTGNSIANYLRLQYFRNENYVGAATTKVLKSDINLDTVFGDIRLPERPGTGEVFQNSKSQKLQYVRGGDFDYASYPEAFKDATSVLYFTEIEYANKRSRNKRSRNFEISDSLKISPVFPKNIAFQKILIRENTVASGTPVYVNKYVFEITGYKKEKKGATNIEDLFVLGLTNAEVNLLYAAADSFPALTKRHPQFFVFEKLGDFQDEFNIPFKKYKLKIQGLDESGIVTLKTPATDVIVYSTSKNSYASDNFVSLTSIPICLSDPALITQWEYFGKFKYQSQPGVLVPLDDDDCNDFYFSGVTEAELNADVYFPADSKNVKTAAGLSIKQTNYPLVVIVHGNGHKYESYKRVAEHLAKNGFVVASIDCLQSINNDVKVVATPNPDEFYFVLSGNEYLFKKSTSQYSIRKKTQNLGQSTYTWTPISSPPGRGTIDPSNPPIYYKTSKQLSDSYGMGQLGRANLLLHHLKKLKDEFTFGTTLKLQNNIGLLGHSRGGEAVVIASRLIKNKGVSTPPDITGVDNLNALISLAPSDQSDVEYLAEDTPYLVIYGSKDGDISGSRILKKKNAITGNLELTVRGTGFSLWDRANGQEKSMLFVHGATHNGFVTLNEDDYNRGGIGGTALGAGLNPNDHVENEVNQKTILDAYVNAWFRLHLKNETFWRPIFKGDWVPISSRFKKTDMNIQYKVKAANGLGSSIVKNYEGVADDPVLDNDGATGILGILEKPSYPTFVKADYMPAHAKRADTLWSIDSRVEGFSAHGTRSILLDLSLGSTYTAGTLLNLNVSAYQVISFRIAKVFDMPIDLTSTYGTSKPAPHFTGSILPFADLSNLKIKIDGIEIKVTEKIPDPYRRWDATEYSKSTMKTVRIPLSQFVGINLNNVNEVIFEFNTKSGLVILDDIEFVN